MHPRRAFFKKLKSYVEQEAPGTLAIRPPWAVAERLFLKTCTLCGTCITSCPQKILHYARDTDPALRFYPTVLFENNSCNFCQACVNSCSAGALSLAEGNPRQAYATLTGTCIKQFNQYCTNCLDACPAGAITESQHGVIFDESRCTGCAECMLACDPRAISMQKSEA